MNNLKMMFNLAAAGLLAVTAQNAFADVAKAGKYSIDAGHAAASFSVSHMGYSNLQGRFNDIDGNFKLNPKGKNEVEFVIKTASVDTNHDKRDKHLRSPDFFNSKLYPEMKFSGTDVKFNSKGEVTKINGSLSMHGKTKPVSIKVTALRAAKDPWGFYRVGYQAETTIKRSDFGMDFMKDGIGDEIALNISFEAIKQ
jgi:polyisoprenoid-binding protein YceI